MSTELTQFRLLEAMNHHCKILFSERIFSEFALSRHNLICCNTSISLVETEIFCSSTSCHGATVHNIFHYLLLSREEDEILALCCLPSSFSLQPQCHLLRRGCAE